MSMPSEPPQLVQPAQQETPITTGEPNGPIRRIFMGADGLRTFWKLAIFMTLLMALRSAIRFVLHALHVHLVAADFTVRAEIIRDGLAFLVVLAATALMGARSKSVPLPTMACRCAAPSACASGRVCCGDLSPSAPRC